MPGAPQRGELRPDYGEDGRGHGTGEKVLIFAFPADIIQQAYGDVPKRLKGADSKSARRRKACGGSNPSISDNKKDHPLGWPFLLGI